MVQKVFLVLGIVWMVVGITRFFSGGGGADARSEALQALLMAAVNLAVAWYLAWRQSKREGRQP